MRGLLSLRKVRRVSLWRDYSWMYKTTCAWNGHQSPRSILVNSHSIETLCSIWEAKLLHPLWWQNRFQASVMVYRTFAEITRATAVVNAETKHMPWWDNRKELQPIAKRAQLSDLNASFWKRHPSYTWTRIVAVCVLQNNMIDECPFSVDSNELVLYKKTTKGAIKVMQLKGGVSLGQNQLRDRLMVRHLLHSYWSQMLKQILVSSYNWQQCASLLIWWYSYSKKFYLFCIHAMRSRHLPWKFQN